MRDALDRVTTAMNKSGYYEDMKPNPATSVHKKLMVYCMHSSMCKEVTSVPK